MSGASECWLWTAYVDRDGYGRFGIGQRVFGAHRIAYMLGNYANEIGGMQVLHTCDNPPCCNPSHLYLGTPVDNARDRVLRGRSRDMKGTNNTSAVLTLGKVRMIRAMWHSDKFLQRELACAFSVSESCVAHVVTGRTWKENEDDGQK